MESRGHLFQRPLNRSWTSKRICVFASVNFLALYSTEASFESCFYVCGRLFEFEQIYSTHTHTHTSWTRGCCVSPPAAFHHRNRRKTLQLNILKMLIFPANRPPSRYHRLSLSRRLQWIFGDCRVLHGLVSSAVKYTYSREKTCALRRTRDSLGDVLCVSRACVCVYWLKSGRNPRSSVTAQVLQWENDGNHMWERVGSFSLLSRDGSVSLLG